MTADRHVMAVLERQDTVVPETRRPAPDGHVTVVETHARRTFGAAQTAAAGDIRTDAPTVEV